MCLPIFVRTYATAIETTVKKLQAHLPRRSGHTVLLANVLRAIQQQITSDAVKAATEPLYHPTRSTPNSVRTAMFALPLLNEYPESVSLKCTGCKEVHEHTYVKVMPVDDNVSTDPIELLKLTKRLTCCSNCGLLKLIN